MGQTLIERMIPLWRDYNYALVKLDRLLMKQEIKMFDEEMINKHLEILKKANIRYIMSVDPCGENDTSGYCLMQVSDDPERFPPRVILSKQGRNDEEFKQEYNNLAKYFNAKINVNNEKI